MDLTKIEFRYFVLVGKSVWGKLGGSDKHTTGQEAPCTATPRHVARFLCSFISFLFQVIFQVRGKQSLGWISVGPVY